MSTDKIAQIAIRTWQEEFKLFLDKDYRRTAPGRRQPGEKTIQAACQHVRVFVSWWEAKYQERFEPQAITNFDLHAYRMHSLDVARVAPDTWNARLWALRIFCEWVKVTFGESYADLAEGIEPKEQGGVRPSRYRSLTEQEYGYLVHRLERRTREAVTEFEHQCAIRDWAMVATMLFAGLRVEEVSNLDRGDVEIHERSGSVRVRNGKGSKERVIPLNHSARRALSAWQDFQVTEGGSLFSGKRSARLSTRQIERVVATVGAEARVPGLSPHWLRYTFAKRLEQQAVTIEQIRALLGHESIETTRRYLRSSFDELQGAVERI